MTPQKSGKKGNRRSGRRTGMPRGRPSEFTEEVQNKILLYLRAGNYVETAAVSAGISKVTFYAWLKLGAAGREPYAAFLNAVEKALADGEVRDTATVFKAGQDEYREEVTETTVTKADGSKETVVTRKPMLLRRGEWQAVAWRLERRFPRKWGRKDRMEHTGPGGGPVAVSSGLKVTTVPARKVKLDASGRPVLPDEAPEA